MKRIILYVLLVYALSYALYTVWANTLPEIIVMSFTVYSLDNPRRISVYALLASALEDLNCCMKLTKFGRPSLSDLKAQ
jgi:hypothetical protein